MGPVLDSINRLIENRSNTEYSVSQTIAARDRMDKDLSDLTTTIDNEALALSQNGGHFDDPLSLTNQMLYLKNSKSPISTPPRNK